MRSEADVAFRQDASSSVQQAHLAPELIEFHPVQWALLDAAEADR